MSVGWLVCLSGKAFVRRSARRTLLAYLALFKESFQISLLRPLISLLRPKISFPRPHTLSGYRSGPFPLRHCNLFSAVAPLPITNNQKHTKQGNGYRWPHIAHGLLVQFSLLGSCYHVDGLSMKSLCWLLDVRPMVYRSASLLLRFPLKSKHTSNSSIQFCSPARSSSPFILLFLFTYHSRLLHKWLLT